MARSKPSEILSWRNFGLIGISCARYKLIIVWANNLNFVEWFSKGSIKICSISVRRHPLSFLVGHHKPEGIFSWSWTSNPCGLIYFWGPILIGCFLCCLSSVAFRSDGAPISILRYWTWDLFIQWRWILACLPRQLSNILSGWLLAIAILTNGSPTKSVCGSSAQYQADMAPSTAYEPTVIRCCHWPIAGEIGNRRGMYTWMLFWAETNLGTAFRAQGLSWSWIARNHKRRGDR